MHLLCATKAFDKQADQSEGGSGQPSKSLTQLAIKSGWAAEWEGGQTIRQTGSVGLSGGGCRGTDGPWSAWGEPG